METTVVIVGKGIAGLVLSILLRRSGIDHVILERRNGRKELALGETLPPSALPLLQSLELLDAFESCALAQTHGYHTSWGNATLTNSNFFGQSTSPHGLKLDKQALYERLALQSGVVTQHYAGNLRLHPQSQKWKVHTQNGPLTCEFLVDATGRNRVVMQKLEVPTYNYDSLAAFSCHVPAIRHPQMVYGVLVEAFEHGWGIVSALDDARSSMTLYTHAGSALLPRFRDYRQWASILAETNYLQHFLAPQALTKVIGANANSSRAGQFAGRKWLAVGDAALAFDPLSSHGISNAIYTAQRAAAAIEAHLKDQDASALEAYATSLEEIFEQYLIHHKQMYWSENRWPDAAFWKN